MNLKRPYVICHMASTVDGRIIGENWGDKATRKAFSEAYEQCHLSFDSQAWMVGRVTMEKDFTGGKQPEIKVPDKPIAREPFVGDKEARSFAIAVDGNGKLGWEENEIDGDHVIEILTEQVSDGYLSYLQQQSVSYVFAGKHELDFNLALSQLGMLFPIQTIMLEGGGHINGSLLNAGLIDEISLLILPLADGTAKTVTSFELGNLLSKTPAQPLILIDMQKLAQDLIWLRYKIG